jgi:hypothetical protein
MANHAMTGTRSTAEQPAQFEMPMVGYGLRPHPPYEANSGGRASSGRKGGLKDRAPLI